MSGADYALCDSCERKVFYDADADIPVGTVILHVDCALKEQAAAEARGYDRAIANLRDEGRVLAFMKANDDALYLEEHLLWARYLEAVKETPDV